MILCCEVLDILINTEKLEEVTDSIFSAIITFQGLFKQIYVSYQIKHFQHLVACIDFAFYKASHPFMSQKETIIKSSHFYTKTITVFVSSICLLSSFFYPFIPLSASFNSNKVETNISTSRPLPYSVWFPLDKNQTPYYELLYSVMSFNAIFVALYISSTDTFIISLIIHTFKQFDILQFLLRNMKEDAISHMKMKNPKLLTVKSDKQDQICENILEGQQIELHNKEDTHIMIYDTKQNLLREGSIQQVVNKELQCSLDDCIKQHQQLLTVSEILNKVVSPFFLEQWVIDVFVLCIMALYITVVPVLSFKFASALAILVSTLTILALLNWCGGELSLKSQAVGYAAYESDWFDAPPSIKHSLHLVMTRTGRPCRITAGNFMDLNLESYFLVLKTSFSYFTVLQSLYHG